MMALAGPERDGPAPLGEPIKLPNLPAAWKLALKVCPWCRGLGSEDDGSECLHCAGSGDCFGRLLLEAYERGRDHVIERIRAVESVRKGAVEQVYAEAPSQEQLRRVIGI